MVGLSLLCASVLIMSHVSHVKIQFPDLKKKQTIYFCLEK